MAVPKKRKSKSKTKSRKHVWKRQASREASKAISLAKSILTGRSTGFIYLNEPEAPSPEAETLQPTQPSGVSESPVPMEDTPEGSEASGERKASED